MKNKSQKKLLEFALENRKINEEQNNGKMFVDQIFLGAGHPTDEKQDFSGQNVALLHHILDLAIKTIGDMQQNGLQGYEFDEESDAEGSILLGKLVQEINTALLGKREPMAYIVFCPNGEYDYKIFTDEHDAEIVAEEYNDQENTDHYKAIPLFM